MHFAGKNPQFQVKLPANSGKITCKCTEEYPQSRAKIPAVSGNLLSHRGLSSPTNCRFISLHAVGEVTRNLRALERAVVSIQ